MATTGPGNVVITGAVIESAATPGLTGNYYNLSVENTDTLIPPNGAWLQGGNAGVYNAADWMGNLTPQVSELLTSGVNGDISDNNYSFTQFQTTNGAAGPYLTNGVNNVGALWIGFVTLPASLGSAPYAVTFYTTSDDGSRIWIQTNTNYPLASDQNMVVENNWFQGETTRQGTVSLIPGVAYPIEIGYYQGGGGAGMAAGWNLPGGTPWGGAWGYNIIPSYTAATGGFTAGGQNKILAGGTGTLSINPTLALSTALTLAANSGATMNVNAIDMAGNKLIFGGAGQINVSGVISSSASGDTVTFNGGTGGGVTLAKTDTYDGPTTINGGTVVADAAEPLGTGAATLSGGFFEPMLLAALDGGSSMSVNGGTILLPFNLPYVDQNTTPVEPIYLQGQGSGGLGAIDTIGTQSLTLPFTIVGNVNISSATGTLTIPQNLYPNQYELTLGGAGNMNVTGNIEGLQSNAKIPGLAQGFEGNQQGNATPWTIANPENAATYGTNAPGQQPVVMFPTAGEQHADPPGSYGGYTWYGTVWGNNDTDVYSGYMYIPANVTQVQFAGSIDDGWTMTFNGVSPMQSGGYHQNSNGATGWAWNDTSAPITVTPGTWYPIEIWFANGGGGAGNAWGGLPASVSSQCAL